MKTYFRFIIYYVLSVVDSVINLLFSLFYLYPKLDLSGKFFVATEYTRIQKIRLSRIVERENKASEALEKIKKIKDEYGKDVEEEQ